MESDDSVRVVIVTGGGKAFVAGAEISLMERMTPREARELALAAHQAFERMERSSTPYIAAVNGYALGGGCELAMACDIRIASENARFGQPEVNPGIILGFGGTQRLPRLVGTGRALEMILTGAMIDAREAERIGLVNRVTTTEGLMDEARRLARRIAGGGRIALSLAKGLVRNALETDLARGCDHEAALFGFLFSTEDQREGMTAFWEKRPLLP
ncbi:MAG: enoyl-CoA hydratase-related protein [Desulfuromonadia bacterium]